MKRIAFVTCSSQPDLTPSDRLVLPWLSDSGISVVPRPWDYPGIIWDDFDGIIMRSAWNYDTKYPAFLKWLMRLETEKLSVLNPVPVIRWNTDKSYLSELSRNGIPTVPSVYLASGSDSGYDIPAWDRIVVKPSVGISANGVRQFSASDRRWKSYVRMLLRSGPVVISQFQDSIRSGEYSLIYFDRVFSHAVLKKPTITDFRVQTGYGGTVIPIQPPADILPAAEAILQMIPGPLLYARVDGIVSENGFMLMELELCEPELFLDRDTDAAKRFALSIRNAFS